MKYDQHRKVYLTYYICIYDYIIFQHFNSFLQVFSFRKSTARRDTLENFPLGMITQSDKFSRTRTAGCGEHFFPAQRVCRKVIIKGTYSDSTTTTIIDICWTINSAQPTFDSIRSFTALATFYSQLSAFCHDQQPILWRTIFHHPCFSGCNHALYTHTLSLIILFYFW